MSEPLISVQDLHRRLGQVSVLDVRWALGVPAGEGEFLAGHVPGAAYVDLDADLADPPGPGGRHPLPDERRFEAAMRRVGVAVGRPVVVYDGWAGRAAARAWWLLRFHGHPDVRVLDGGWDAWRAAGLPVEQGPTVVDEGDFTVAREKGMPVVEAGEVLGVDVLIDARAPERFSGEQEPVDPVGGHIPGARNVPTNLNLGPDGTFRDGDTLADTYAGAGALPGADVVVYCGSGVTAAHGILALEVTGVRAALYPGSWSGWITDPSRAVERSAG